jgi:hypothetical protein
VIDALIEKAWWVRGITTGRGVALVRRDYVAFVPTERPKNLAVEFAWGAAGFVEVGARKIAPEMLIHDLATAIDVDARVRTLITQLAGHLWAVGEARLLEGRIPLRRSRRRLWFRKGDQDIRLARAVPVAEVETLRPFLAAWPPVI